MIGLINDSGYGNIIRDARNEMDNRGSKSANIAVKEQRVDGSSVLINIVRCTLVAGKPVLERKYKSNSRLKITTIA